MLTVQKARWACASLALFSAPLLAQRVPANYSVATYRHVDPDKVDAFLAFERSDGKKLYQSLIAQGRIKSWILLKLTMPYAMSSDHNYVVLTGSETFPNLDLSAAELDSAYEKAGLNRAEYARKNRELSKGVYQVVTRTRLRVGRAEPGDFLRVDYHMVAPERLAEIAELEEEVYAPLHKALIEAGDGFKSWTLATPVMPMGAELGWNFLTTQAFKDAERLGKGSGAGEEVFRKTLPNRNFMATMERVHSGDKIVKSRVYHILEMAGSPVMPTKAD